MKNKLIALTLLLAGLALVGLQPRPAAARVGLIHYHPGVACQTKVCNIACRGYGFHLGCTLRVYQLNPKKYHFYCLHAQNL